ncbi:unnamed protein product [Caenorhabditis brenneri]
MLRFNSDYKKADKQKNMEFSLLFFLTLEMIAVGYEYITLDTVKISNNNAIQWFFIIWVVSLFAASLLIMAFKEVTFAICYFLHRVIQLDLVLYVFLCTEEVVISPYLIGFCFLEMAYLVNGITHYNMYYPGNWIKKVNNMCKEFNDSKTIENARGSSFSTYELEMDAKDISFDDQFTDDLFDYYTAFEDTPSAIDSKKHRGTFIV